jgi:hypothetical protein
VSGKFPSGNDLFQIGGDLLLTYNRCQYPLSSKESPCPEIFIVVEDVSDNLFEI